MTLVVFSGRGWLRTRGAGFTTADYRINITMEHGSAHAEGVLRADSVAMAKARLAGHTTLVLETGRSITVDVIGITMWQLSFAVMQSDAEMVAAHPNGG